MLFTLRKLHQDVVINIWGCLSALSSIAIDEYCWGLINKNMQKRLWLRDVSALNTKRFDLQLGNVESGQGKPLLMSNLRDIIWASSGRWWRTGKPGVLQSMESQRVGNDWAKRFLFSALPWFPSPVLANLLEVFLKVTSFYVDRYYIKKMIRLYFYECSLRFRYRIYSLLFVISAAWMPIASDHLWLGWVSFIVVMSLQGFDYFYCNPLCFVDDGVTALNV